MTMIYQATGYATNPTRLVLDRDFDDEADAKKAIEACDEGRLVTFVRSRNLPGCLPEYVDKSCGMDCWNKGAWRAVNIFEGSY